MHVPAVVHARRGTLAAPLIAGGLAIAGLVAAAPAPAIARPAERAAPIPTEIPFEQRRETTVVGEAVDTGCFVMAGRRGSLHGPCATACARAGQPIGILDRSGRLTVAVFDHRSDAPENLLVDHLAQTVEVSGIPVERGGLRAIFVRRVRVIGGKTSRD